MATLETVGGVSRLMKGVNHFLPHGTSRALTPNELFQSQTSALAWLSSPGADRFLKMVDQIKNGPLECVFGNEKNRQGKVNLFLLDLKFCRQHFGWTEADEEVLLSGMHAYTIIDQTDAYEALQKILDGTNKIVDSVISDIQDAETARRVQIELKWKKRGALVREKALKIIEIVHFFRSNSRGS